MLVIRKPVKFAIGYVPDHLFIRNNLYKFLFRIVRPAVIDNKLVV